MKRMRLIVAGIAIAAGCLTVPMRADAKPCAQHKYKMCGGGECPTGETCYSVHKACVCKPTKAQPHHVRTSVTPKSPQPMQ